MHWILFFCYFTEYMWIHIVIENSDPCKDLDLFPFLIAVYETNPGLILFWRVNREAFDYVVALHDWYRWFHLHWGNFHKFPTVTFGIFGVCDLVNKSFMLISSRWDFKDFKIFDIYRNMSSPFGWLQHNEKQNIYCE